MPFSSVSHLGRHYDGFAVFEKPYRRGFPIIDTGTTQQNLKLRVVFKAAIVVGWCVLIATLIIPGPRVHVHRASCAVNLSNLGKSSVLFSIQHNARGPSDLKDLLRDGKPPELLICPGSGTKLPSDVLESNDYAAIAKYSDYVFLPMPVWPEYAEYTDPNWVMAFELPANHAQKRANLLFADIHVAALSAMNEYLRAIQFTNEGLATARRKQSG